MSKEDVIKKIKKGLIVSCQALPGEAMYSSDGGVMPLFAKAAARAGAVGIRANSIRDISQIKEVVDLPIIGIIKRDYPDSSQYITVTMKEVDELASIGVDIIAIDATFRKRPGNEELKYFIKRIKNKYPNQLLMADISTFEEGIYAEEIGFDLVGTTLSGYTDYTCDSPAPNFDLVSKLEEHLTIPVIAEGQIVSPDQAKKMLEIGAYSVVVGGAITRPQQIAESFVNEIKKKQEEYYEKK